jgi:hypothetical protein
MTDTPTWHRAIAWCTAAVLFACANWLTAGNTGYFSHDELQWGSAAAVASIDALPFVAWSDVGAFQYRPLTFNLWLLLSHHLFAHPVQFHQVFLALAFGVCTLLFAALWRAGASPGVAAGASAAFALNPFAMYVHGWVATLGDLLWTSAALTIAWRVLASPAAAWRGPALIGALLTTLALLAKEAALAIPALLAMAWLMSREARWRAALLGSALPTAVYLALRLPLLLSSPRPGGAYAWSLDNIPARVAEFHVWPLVPTLLEMTSLWFASPLRLLAVASVALALLAAVAQSSRRLAGLMVGGTAIALGPTIVLAANYPQYGYAASALACACVALAWPRMKRPARVVVVTVSLLTTWHGVNVQREMLRVGRIEAKFTPSLKPWLQQPGDTLVLVAAVPSDAWIYQRLTQALPAARRSIEVHVAGGGIVVAPDGRVRAPPLID